MRFRKIIPKRFTIFFLIDLGYSKSVRDVRYTVPCCFITSGRHIIIIGCSQQTSSFIYWCIVEQNDSIGNARASHDLRLLRPFSEIRILNVSRVSSKILKRVHALSMSCFWLVATMPYYGNTEDTWLRSRLNGYTFKDLSCFVLYNFWRIIFLNIKIICK